MLSLSFISALWKDIPPQVGSQYSHQLRSCRCHLLIGQTMIASDWLKCIALYPYNAMHRTSMHHSEWSIYLMGSFIGGINWFFCLLIGCIRRLCYLIGQFLEWALSLHIKVRCCLWRIEEIFKKNATTGVFPKSILLHH